MSDVLIDRDYLASQYGSPDNLAARQSIYRYLDTPTDFPTWCLEQITWRGDERVLDVGCGNGAYLRLVRTLTEEPPVGLDLSEGMLRDIAASSEGWASPLVVGDAQTLPFAGDVFDVVLAMHVLFHVPDIEAALREFSRVLGARGALLVATNAEAHLAEIRSLYDDAVASIAGRSPTVGATAHRFRLDDEAQDVLETSFAQVTRHDFHGTLRIPDADPVVNYVSSARERRQHVLPSEVGWRSVITAVKERVEQAVRAHGHFEVNVHSGVFVCRRGE